jgi:hypothetical protein
MMSLPAIFPFSKLKLRDGEALQWVGYNPTFHRFTAYGIAITDVAFYACFRAWIFSKWNRYALSEISNALLTEDLFGRPTIEFEAGDRKVAFHAPYDSHKGEVEFDKTVLSKAIELLYRTR